MRNFETASLVKSGKMGILKVIPMPETGSG
jgi:hypothetical protein